MRRLNATRWVAEERGAVLPWFALWLPLLVAMVVFVVDVGNWFEHRRHLQTQVDAAALAGGGRFAFPCTAGIQANIETTARDYAGPHNTHLAAPYNAQVGGTPGTRMHMLINSLSFWNEGGTNYSDGGNPCVTGFLDVKGTEQDLPWLIPFMGSVVPAINARARITILAAEAVSGSLPIFVRDINPASAAAIFVSEPTLTGTGGTTKLDAQYLTKVDTIANPSACSSGVACWNNAGEPATVTAAAHTSLVIALSSLPRCAAGETTGCLSLAGSADAICAQFSVECYWADEGSGAVNRGIVYLRGYSPLNIGVGQPPDLADVELLGTGAGAATCPVGSFDYRETGSCTMQVSADVGLPVGVLESNLEIRMFAPGCNNQGCVMTRTGGRYTGLVDVDAALVPPTIPIEIRWEIKQAGISVGGLLCTRTGSNPCKGTFGNVQRAFSASDPTTGPLRYAEVSEGGVRVSSLPLGTAHSLIASIRIAGAVATDSSSPPSAGCPGCTGDPAIRLRVVSGSQSAIDCENNVTFREEMTRGCRPTYTINDRLSASDPCDPPYGGNQATLFSTPQPPAWDCVAVGPGASVGQFTDGLLGRVFNSGQLCTGGGCPTATQAQCDDPDFVGRNNWNPSPNPYNWGLGGANNGFPSADPRVVILFMVPFGAFRSQGRALYPVSNFGAFYLTDWGGNGADDDPCGTDPVPTGWLAGHFIKYVTSPNVGGGSGPCDFSTTTPCVAVLTE
jgi:hypothetical protein